MAGHCSRKTYHLICAKCDNTIMISVPNGMGVIGTDCCIRQPTMVTRMHGAISASDAQRLCVNPWRTALVEAHEIVKTKKNMGKKVRLFDPEVLKTAKKLKALRAMEKAT